MKGGWDIKHHKVWGNVEERQSYRVLPECVLRRRRKGRCRTLNLEVPMFDVVPYWLLIAIPCRALLYSLLVEWIFSKKKLGEKKGKKKLTNIRRNILIRIRWYSWGRPHECEYLNLCIIHMHLISPFFKFKQLVSIVICMCCMYGMCMYMYIYVLYVCVCCIYVHV